MKARLLNSKNRIKSILGGALGNLIEWYDWYIYSAFSLYFASSFFPKGNLTAQLLNTAAIFAVGFLMRPVGGLLMGVYADRYGRKKALTFSVILMCFGSLLIALAPTYDSIGMLSPAILIFARLIQGISVGGEYGVSATYLSEMATSRYRGFYSSFQYVTLIMGQLIALSVLILLQRYLLTTEQLYSWGWRIPFLIGALGAYVGFYLRCRIKETESFANEDPTALKKNPIRGLMQHPKEVMIVIGLTMGGTLAFYTYSTYMQKFIVNTIGLSRDTATMLSASTLFIFMIVQPLFGLLSDVIGRKPLLITFGILGTLTTVPILTALSSTQNCWVIFALITTALLIVANYTSINAIVKAELFPVEIRALGVSLPYALAVSFFGGTAEYLALWLKQMGHEPWFFWYVSACIALSLLVYIAMPDTKSHSRLDEDK
ncbi:MAG: MFS transporter [Legionellaceae bacterium]|nr:MFS transporter [Legionellaceae bacterium]